MFDEYPKWIGTDPSDLNAGFIVLNADEEAEKAPKKASKAGAKPAEASI